MTESMYSSPQRGDRLSTPLKLTARIGSTPGLVMTLSSLAASGGSAGPGRHYLSLEYPTTFMEGDIRNEKLYPMYDYNSGSLAARQSLLQWRFFPFIGNELPILLDWLPPAHLVRHWRQWIPGFEDPVTVSFSDGLADSLPIRFSIPHEQVPAQKHAVNPDVWYMLDDKISLPRCGVRTPRRLQRLSSPCMVKVSHSSGSLGVWRVESEAEGHQLVDRLRSHGWHGDVIYEEIVTNIVLNVCAQFYLHDDGSHTWVGVTHQLFDAETGHFAGGLGHWSQQDTLRDKLLPFLTPTMTWLHVAGYSGYCGVDVLEDAAGLLYAVDINPRLCGSTPLLLLAPVMAAASRGLDEGRIRSATYPTTAAQLVSVADELNRVSPSGSVFVVLSALDGPSHGCDAYVCCFAASQAEIDDLLIRVEKSALLLGSATPATVDKERS